MTFPAAAKTLFSLSKESNTLLTFQDVLLEPQYSEIESRAIISLETNVTPLRKLQIPIVAANMDTICESAMAIALGKLGGLGVIHRYMDYERQIKEVQKTALALEKGPVAVAIGVKNGVIEQFHKLVAAGADIIVIDVAHGDHKLVIDLIGELKKFEAVSNGLPVEFIAGNVATPTGLINLFEAGADAVKVGVGAGSICSTRTVTGHGIPQLTAIAACALQASHYNKPIIADGGFKNSGDLVKALAAGANTVMTGFLLAGADETPGYDVYGETKAYRGMASREAQKDFYGNNPDAPEGINARIATKGPISHVIKQLTAAIRSGLSYSGVNNITELQQGASFVRISNNSYLEGLTLND
jgi:IMP dehydrogenase